MDSIRAPRWTSRGPRSEAETTSAAAGRGARLARLLAALGVAAVVFAAALVAMAIRTDHVDDAGVLAAVVVVVGLSFVGVGIYAWWRRPENRFGALMVGAGFAWFVEGLTLSNVPLIFSIGGWLSALYLAVTVHLLLAFPTGRLESRADRRLTAAAYFTAIVGLLLAGVFTQPSLDGGCDGCPDNALMIVHSKAASSVFDVLSSLGGLVIFALVARVMWKRWRGGAARQRRALAPVLVAGVIAGCALVVVFAADTAGLDPVHQIAELATILALAAVPWCFLVGLARSAVTRGETVGDLIARLRAGLQPRELRDVLAGALGDESVQVAYWIPEAGHYVDERGRELRLPADGDGRAVTPVELDGLPVGAIVHDAAGVDEPELVRAIADGAALAFQREGLEAELRVKVEELSASRARIVEAGYTAARRLERDLHDGAQQRLVSLALALRMAENRIEDDPVEGRRMVAAAREELGLAIDELRDFARGLHPGLLSTRGLDAALGALATRASLPVEVRGRVNERLPEGVESATYFVVSEALTNVAKYAEAESALVTVARGNGALVVEVTDDGRGGADPSKGSGLSGLSDRVAALDGRFEVESAPGGGTTVRATIPLTAVRPSSS
jgi:signal transduction histidine kinase